MDPMLESFITESRENLESAGACFLELEKKPGDEALMNDLFRAIHTIKGSSGLFELPDLTSVVHAAEDILDSARSGELELTSEHIDLFLDTMDQVSSWLDQLENEGSLGDDSATISQQLTQRLRAVLAESAPSAADEPADEAVVEEQDDAADSSEAYSQSIPQWLYDIDDRSRQKAYQQSLAQQDDTPCAVLLVRYIPDEQCFFAGDDPLHTVRNLPGLIWFSVHPKNDWPEPESLDPFVCNLVFDILACVDEQQLREYFRYVAEQIEVSVLTPEQLVFARGEWGEDNTFDSFYDDFSTALAQSDSEQMQKLLSALQKISNPDLLQTSALQWMQLLLEQQPVPQQLLQALLQQMRSGEHIEAAAEVVANDAEADAGNTEDADAGTAADENSQQPVLDEQQLVAIQQVLQTQKLILAMPCEASLLVGRIASITTVVGHLLRALGKDDAPLIQVSAQAQAENQVTPLLTFLDNLQLGSVVDEAVQKHTEAETTAVAVPANSGAMEKPKKMAAATKKDRAPAAAVAQPTQQTSVANKVLKVDQHRLDALMDLVGELVVAKNALPFLAKRAEDDFGIRALAKEITAQYAVINRLSEELQSTMMQIRMVPISNVFQRFPRLVRDLSRKLNKDIRLELEGETTEADKNVVENLADPLIHLVRNSLDHGLETPEERQQAGKDPQGMIKLRAVPHDDQVIIEVIDDGRGIDPQVIKRKAYEKGIIDEHRLDSISDHEAIQLIMAPGFSTAEQISDISGRGVGMDVVHSTITQAGGHVIINSIKGRGTTIKLALPLSMAVSHVMMIEVMGQIYGIAMEHIVETVRIERQEIKQIKHNDVIVLRDRLIPLYHLRQLLQLHGECEKHSDEIAVLVMNLNGQEVGLVIDDFHEGIDIIQKPLEGVMAHYPWYSGAALLGDGRVLLILNIKELLACR